MDDLISRQAAISAICNACGKIDCDKMDKCEKLQLPPANCSEFPNNSDTISRQAAIDRLTEYGNGRAVFISVGEAIIRIEQLPPAQPKQLSTNLAEVGTDCISRQMAIEAIDSFNVFESRGDQIKLEQMIGELPPIQPERIKGHWVNGRCDKCNEHAPFWAMASTYHESNFCPNCGADMRQREE